jgi:hypothetical protein
VRDTAGDATLRFMDYFSREFYGSSFNSRVGKASQYERDGVCIESRLGNLHPARIMTSKLQLSLAARLQERLHFCLRYTTNALSTSTYCCRDINKTKSNTH